MRPNHCVILINAFREFIFETRHVFRDTFIGARSLESQFERGRHGLARPRADASDPHRLDASAADDNALQVSSIKVEASGLFLLCSSSLALRKLESKPSKRLANLTALPLYRHYLSGTRAYSYSIFDNTGHPAARARCH